VLICVLETRRVVDGRTSHTPGDVWISVGDPKDDM
jgi:hypothetical protein